MAVFRVQKTKDYTVMSNAHLREKGMSIKAKGLLSIMLSLPDEWDYSIKGLCELSKDGYESIMNALQEIEKFGYLKRTRATDERGKFAGFDYEIFETPQSGFPITEKPCTEKPCTGNPEQLNTNKQNTNKQNTGKEKTTTTTTESACAREEESEVIPPAFSAIYAHFRDRGIEDARNEAEKFEAYNARRGWDCLPDWKPTADLWAARIEDRNRRAS